MQESIADVHLERRWVRSSDVATLVKHMGRVIDPAEWEAAVNSIADHRSSSG